MARIFDGGFVRRWVGMTNQRKATICIERKESHSVEKLDRRFFAIFAVCFLDLVRRAQQFLDGHSKVLLINTVHFVHKDLFELLGRQSNEELVVHTDL